MSLLWCDELYPAMPVLRVVPADEAVHPLSRLAYIAEAIHWPFRAVFQRTEQRLRVRVVIADPRSAERRADTQFVHFGQHREALHRRPVV